MFCTWWWWAEMPLLNTANKLYLGTAEVGAAYLGTTKVWPSFSPAILTGLAVWFDAADYAAGVWPNRVAGKPSPVLKGSPAPVRTFKDATLPLVRFTVSEGRFRIAAGTGVNMTWTLVYVARMVPGFAGRIVNAIYPPANLLVGFWNGFEDVCYDNGFMTPNTQVSITSNWHLYSGDGIVGLTRFFGNGALLGTSTTSAGWNESLALSGYDAEVTSETCDCEIAEVCLYDRRLTGPDRAKVENYLRAKWGL